MVSLTLLFDSWEEVSHWTASDLQFYREQLAAKVKKRRSRVDSEELHKAEAHQPKQGLTWIWDVFLKLAESSN